MRRPGDVVSTELRRIAELARQDREMKFTSLAHHLTPMLLLDSFELLNQKGAPGSDGMTMEEFKADIGKNILSLHGDLKAGKYRASSVRRKYIPKADGKQRPLGIPTVRDRVVQRAVAEIIGAIYEPYFLDCSHGFRPGRSTHNALESLRKTVDRSRIRYIVDADIKGYFDNVNHEWMLKFLRHRIVDRTILRLVAKWLKAGVMENGVVVRSEKGTPQGGPISPLLANIYLHYVLDIWFERKFKRACRGHAALVRYADDFVVCFEHKDEAEKFHEEIRERFAEFHLELSEEKTRIIEFGKESDQNGKRGPSDGVRTFDFLGFTHYMRKWKNAEDYHVVRKPSRKSRNRFLVRVREWCEEHRHLRLRTQGEHLKKMLHGYYNYFGLAFCRPALRHVKWHVTRLWVSILRRRSQRHKLYWNRITGLAWMKILPDPKPYQPT